MYICEREDSLLLFLSLSCAFFLNKPVGVP